VRHLGDAPGGFGIEVAIEPGRPVAALEGRDGLDRDLGAGDLIADPRQT
jgi:hypothetical protein